MINRGTIILQGTANFGGRGLSVLHNEGLFDVQSDADFGGESFSGATFINTGTLRKSGGTDVTFFNFWWIFENQGGTIEAQTGTLEYSGGGSFNGGTYNIGESAIITLTGSTWVFSNSLNGTSDGIFSLNGAIIDTDSSSVSLNIQGAGFQFIDGTITGSGTVIIPYGALFVLPGIDYAILQGATTILNQGTIRMGGAQYFSISGLSTIDNQSLFEIISDADFNGGNGVQTFLNTGTVRKSGGSDLTVFDGTMYFHNQGGVIDVQTGTLEFGGSGSFENGTYNIAENAVLNLKSGTQIFKGTLNVSSAGIFSLNGADISTDSTVITLNIQGNAFNWVRGELTGGGTLIIPDGVQVNLTGTDYAGIDRGTTLLNMGTIKLGGTIRFTAQYSSIIDNRSLFEITSDNDLYAVNGGGTFLNTGTLIKSGGSDVSGFSSQWKVRNKSGGIIDAASGELEFSDFENPQDAVIKGGGSIDVPGAFTNDGITAPGNSAGILSYIGNFLPSATAVLDVQLGGSIPADEYDQLNITGSAKLNGTLKVSLIDGFMPSAGDSLVVLTATSAITDSFLTINAQSGLYLTAKKNTNNVTIVVDSVGVITSIVNDKEAALATSFSLSQNYPNPFNPNTNIRFALPQTAFVTLEVFNVVGERVDILVSGELNAGEYNFEWNGLKLTSGVYFYRLQAGNFVGTKKMILLK
jgi:hypothetical protein